MNELECPWCEASLAPEALDARQHTCPECATTWSYEDESVELALAA